MFEINCEDFETISKQIGNYRNISNRPSNVLNSRRSFLPKNIYSFQRKSFSTSQNSFQEMVENATFYQIASLIPDEVLLNSSDYKMRSFESSVLFADISGFTDLCEKYQNLENGASKLTAVLNFYLGIMVQEILSHHGDIIKYAGDAFIAIFRKEHRMSIQNSIHEAIDTAIIIQKNCKNFRTEVGVTLNVKIAISCGEVDFQLIGDELSSHYAIIGEPVWHVKALQEFISAGEILLSRKAWHYTQQSLYTYEMMKDHNCYKILGFMEQINLIQRQYEATINFQELQKNLNKNIDVTSVSNVMLEGSVDPLSYTANQNEIFSLRHNIHLITSLETRKNLQRFVIAPLLNAIEMGDSIESLTEMRNIVTVFVNFIISSKDSKQILSITNKIYKKLYSIVSSYEGVLNKVSLFDKDMMFLNIFGLRGLQHEYESEIGLRCAKELHQTFSKWKEISKVSIGVTSGKGYCGVVGHTLRREYSVIGVTVNRAARFMVAYPNVVSCDTETLIESKINLKHFRNLPRKELKGISDKIVAYEFCGTVEKQDTDVNENEIIHGRQELIYEIKSCLVNAIMRSNSIVETEPINGISCFILKGENGEGKSKVLNCFYRDILKSSSVKCVKLLLNTKHSTMSNWLIRHCFKKFIETEYKSTKEFMEATVKKFKHFNIDQYLFLLNEIIGTSFGEYDIEINDDDRMEIQKLMIVMLSKNLRNFWAILIDDADYIDLSSLKFINSIMTSQTVFIILTIGKSHKKWTLQQGKFIKNEHIMQYNLKPIDKAFEKDIACQSINVSAIPIELEHFIHKNSNGNAGWIDTCAKTLLYSGKLKIISISASEAVKKGMIMTNELTNNELDDFFHIKSQQRVSGLSQYDKVMNVAIIEGVLREKDYTMGYKNSKLMVYDTLSSFDQMICKCASVMGENFYRNQLNYLITKVDYRQVGKTIVKLFQLNILFCASPRSGKNEVVFCSCKNVEISESCRDLPQYSNCAYMTFNDESFRKHVYDTLTEKQRVEYHQKCLNFLCRTAKTCNCCRNGRFEIIEIIKLNLRDGYVKYDCKQYKRNENKLWNSITCSNHVYSTSRKMPVVLNYMHYEFRNCKCRHLLSNALNDIVRHCQGKDTTMKKIFSQIAFADASIQVGNVLKAMLFLKASLYQINDSNECFGENVLLFTYLRGKAMILQGMCFEAIGRYKQALDSYYTACDIYKIPFPKKYNLMTRFKLINLVASIKYLLSRPIKSNLTRIQMLIVRQSSNLMQNLFNHFEQNGNKELAILAALWSVKKALKSNREISSLAKSFTNVLKSGASWYIKSFERLIFTQLFKANVCHNVDKDTLQHIIELYTAVMHQQIYRQNIKFAIKIGDLAKKLCYNIGNPEALLDIIPTLFLLYMKTFCIDDCHKLLQELRLSIKFNSNNENANVWFHALCMDLFLDTKKECIVKFDECKDLYVEYLSNQTNERHSEASLRFVANFLSWRAQKSQEDDLQPLELQFIKEIMSGKNLNVNHIYTCLRLKHLLNLYLDREKANGNMESFYELQKFIKIHINQSPAYKFIRNVA